jgi:hypothetical protein
MGVMRFRVHGKRGKGAVPVSAEVFSLVEDISSCLAMTRNEKRALAIPHHCICSIALWAVRSAYSS